MRVLVCGDGLAALRTEKYDFVARRGLFDFSDIDDRVIHADAADKGCVAATDENGKVIAEAAVEAVGISSGEKGETHGMRRDEGAVVSDGCTGGDGAEADDAGLPSENRLEESASFSD